MTKKYEYHDICRAGEYVTQALYPRNLSRYTDPGELVIYS